MQVCKYLFLLALVGVSGWGPQVYSQDRQEKPLLPLLDLSTRVTTQNCHQPLGTFTPLPVGLHERAGTVIQWKQKIWVVSGQVNPRQAHCVKSGEATANLKYLGSWPETGLSLFEPIQPWTGPKIDLNSSVNSSSADSHVFMSPNPNDPHLVEFYKKFDRPLYDQHYFFDNEGWISVDATKENQFGDPSLYRSAGAPLLSPRGFVGIFTDQTMTFFRGYSQTLRDFEIDLLGQISPSIRRLAVSSSKLVSWLEAGGRSNPSVDLTLKGRMVRSEFVTNYWQTSTKDFLETCFVARTTTTQDIQLQKMRNTSPASQSRVYLIDGEKQAPFNLNGEGSNPLWPQFEPFSGQKSEGFSPLENSKPKFQQGPLDLSHPLDPFIFTAPIVVESGGVDPFGIGGADQKVVNCLLSEGEHDSQHHSRVLFTYRSKQNKIDLFEVDNILDLIRFKMKGYEVLLQRDRPETSTSKYSEIYRLLSLLEDYPIDSIPALKQTVRILILMEAKPDLVNWNETLENQISSLRLISEYLGEITQLKSEIQIERLKKTWLEFILELERLKDV